MNPTEPRPAASLVVARDGARGPELYMVKRHPRSAFMANALVFVGGRVDATDSAPEVLGRCRGLEAAEAGRRLGRADPAQALGFYVACVRECLEEAGLLIGGGAERAGEGRMPDIPALRAGLRRGEPFGALLVEHGLLLSLEGLRFLDHWVTPEFEHRRYDTCFFLAAAPAGQEASFEPQEATFGGWLGVTEILEGNEQARWHLAPPTLTILEGLAACRSLDELFAAAPDCPVRRMMPKPLLGQPGPPTLLLPGDHRYEDPGSVDGQQHYVVLEDGRWRRVRSGAATG